MGISGQAALEGGGSEGEHWAVLGMGVPSKRRAVQSLEPEVCGCAVGAELRVEGGQVRGSGDCGVRPDRPLGGPRLFLHLPGLL